MADAPKPLKREYVIEALDSVDQRAVLVGGQAVAWWAEYYAAQGRLSAIEEPTEMYVSKDADFAASSLQPRDLRPMVRDVAGRLRGASARYVALQVPLDVARGRVRHVHR